MWLHRQLLDWEWFDNSQMVHVWIYFLLKANYQDGKWHGIDVPRGSLITSLDTISKDTKLSIREIRTCLNKLKKTGEVTIKTTNKFSVVTICNYDKYNSINSESDKQSDIQTTSKRQASDKQATIDKENNKDRKIEKVKKEKDELFEECWIAYRRKGSKGKAFTFWEKLSAEDQKKVLPHIKAYIEHREIQYQKDFERYLRDRIFETIVMDGNRVVYDPEQFSNATEYRPATDGVFQFWNESRKCLMFNGYIDQLNDGYTNDNRPDGAKVAWSMYTWVWSSERKEWVKQE